MIPAENYFAKARDKDRARWRGSRRLRDPAESAATAESSRHVALTEPHPAWRLSATPTRVQTTTLQPNMTNCCWAEPPKTGGKTFNSLKSAATELRNTLTPLRSENSGHGPSLRHLGWSSCARSQSACYLGAPASFRSLVASRPFPVQPSF